MKLKSFFLLGLIMVSGPFISFAKEEQKKQEADAPAPVAKPKVDKASSEPLAVTPEALQEFQARRETLDRREKELADKERALDVQDKLLQEKLRRMEELNKKMADRLELYKGEHEGKIKKLVTMVETMKPAAAAPYLETVEPFLAVEVLTRIDVTRAAKIMNLVDKKKSARLTELYAGYRDNADDDKQKKEESNATPK